MPTPGSVRRKLLGAFGSGLIVVLFCLVLLRHDPLFFWNDDFQISILPVFADVARSWNEGHVPLLSPYSWVCGNLAGEFEYGTFSIFVNAAVILIWKFPLTFPQQAAALSITHLFVLGAGAFLLAHDRLRQTGVTRRLRRPPLPQGEGGGEGKAPVSAIPLSFFVALIAALNGWIICWGATDWFGALGAFAWLPWAWWGLERALDPARTRYRFLWPAPFVYLLITGGFPYTVVMLVFLIAWLSVKSLVQTRNLMTIVPMFVGVGLGFGLAAPALLALFDYVQGSARQLQSASAHFQWLLPPAALPGLFLPCWTVGWVDFSNRFLPHTATELACGLVAPIALITVFIRHAQIFVRRTKWDLVLLLLVLVMAMVPTAGLFRWSFRWLPLFHLILGICAAEALQTLFRERPRRPGSPVPAAAVLVLAVVTVVMSMLGTGGHDAFPLSWIFLQLAVMWIVSEFFLYNTASRLWAPAGVTLVAFLATYLCLPTNCGVPKFNFSQQLLDPAPLDPARLYLSIYPPPETEYRVEAKPEPVGQVLRIGSTSMWAGLRLINGYSPIRPAGVARHFESAIHGEIEAGTGEYLLKQQAGPDGKLVLVGIDGITIARELSFDPQPASEWSLFATTEEGRVFHRRGPPLERVRSISAVDSRTGEQFATALISQIDDSRNRVEATIDVPAGDRAALLVFSRPYFRGYQAHLGQKRLAVESDGLVPVVKVPPGTTGRLTLVYRPAWLIAGTTIASICAAIIAVCLVFRLLARAKAAVPVR